MRQIHQTFKSLKTPNITNYEVTIVDSLKKIDCSMKNVSKLFQQLNTLTCYATEAIFFILEDFNDCNLGMDK